MKIRIERQALGDTLGWVTRVITKSPAVPALGGVRITADGEGLSVRAFDFDTAHQATLHAAEVVTEGECLVPGLFLRDAVAGARGTEVELVLDGDTLTVTSGRSTYRLRTLAVEDYPSLPGFPTEVGTIAEADLSYAVDAVVAAVDDINPTDSLRGLRLEASDQLEVVGLDRPRVHVAALGWDGSPFDTTVPAKSLVAALKGMAGDVTIGADDQLLGLRDGTRTVTTRVYSSEFANWRSAVQGAERQTLGKISVDGADLLAAVKQAGAMVDADTPITLGFHGSEITVRTGAEVGDGVEVLPAEGEGEIELRFGARILADALAATTGGTIELHYGKPGGALLVRDPAWPGLTVVAMSRRAA